MARESIQNYPVYQVAPPVKWVSDSCKFVMMGDAAHAMVPFAAQGAGMAIEDAAVLAQCLGETKNDGEVTAALARYAVLREPRVTRVQRMARQQGKIYHLQGPMALARDTVMRLLGPRRLQARQDWIYNWRL